MGRVWFYMYYPLMEVKKKDAQHKISGGSYCIDIY